MKVNHSSLLAVTGISDRELDRKFNIHPVERSDEYRFRFKFERNYNNTLLGILYGSLLPAYDFWWNDEDVKKLQEKEFQP